MSPTTDDVLRDLEHRALADGVALDELDPWIAGALGVPVACLYAYLRVTFVAERWRLLQDTPARRDVLDVALSPTTAGAP